MNKQKFLEETKLDEYLQQLDEKLNAANIAVKGYNWIKNKWSSKFRSPTKNLGGPGVKSWKQHKE
jgi:hypothetical protein